jgi:O-antigen/teichoic acid export membrane protein
MFALGAATRSIWALVAGGLVASLVITALSHTWMNGHRNRLRWDPSALPELIGFGKWILLSSAVGVAATSGDRLILGALVEPDVLGVYAIAVLITGAIEGVLASLLLAVSLPAFSEIARSDPSRLREAYYRMRLPADLLLLFLAGALGAAGQALIDLLYDPRYSAAGGMLQVLALSLFAARFGVAQQVYMALGIPRYQTYVNIVRFVSLYALLPLLYYLGGMPAAVWGVALHGLATLPFIYRFNARFGLNDWRRELAPLAALPAGFLFASAFTLVRG